MKNNNKNTIIKLSPALGIVFGSALGILEGLLSNSNLALTTGMGVGLGLVIGIIVYATAIQKTK